MELRRYLLFSVPLRVLGDRGAWASSGCAVVSYVAPLVTFKCNHLTNFAVAEVLCNSS